MDRDKRLRFGADIDGFVGPVSPSAVVSVRDVILCTTGGGGSVEEYRNAPPIGARVSTPHGRGLLVAPVDLGRGIRVERLDDELAALVMHACSPRGHFFVPFRQFGQRYSLVREVPLEQFELARHSWDSDDALWDALSLSRLVRDAPPPVHRTLGW